MVLVHELYETTNNYNKPLMVTAYVCFRVDYTYMYMYSKADQRRRLGTSYCYGLCMVLYLAVQSDCAIGYKAN